MSEIPPAGETGPPAPLGRLVATRLQQLEIAMLGRVLATTLAQALPAHMVDVEWRRGLADRLTRTPAHVEAVTVRAGERTLGFRSSSDGRTESTVSHVVGGVVLSRRAVPLGDWLAELGQLLDRVGAENEATRQALRRALTE